MDGRLFVLGGVLGAAALGSLRGSRTSDPASVVDRDARRVLLAQWLRTMGPGWNQAWSSACARLSEQNGPTLPTSPTPAQVLLLLRGPRGEPVDGEHRVPKAVADAAWQGLVQSHAADYAGERFLGLARAMQLVLLDAISPIGQGRMRAYFQRHAVDKKNPRFSNLTNPSKGRMAWNNWGGDPGERWVRQRERASANTSTPAPPSALPRRAPAKPTKSTKSTKSSKRPTSSRPTHGRIGTPLALGLQDAPKLRAGEVVLVLGRVPVKGRAEILDRLYARARSLGARRAWSPQKLPGFTQLTSTWWERNLG